MSKFNKNASDNSITENKSGVKAFTMSDKEKLVTQVLTSLFNESKFYGDNSNEIVENIRNVLNKEPEFIANLALFARKEMHLRSISHVLVGELANHVNGKPFTRKTINNVIERVDDMTEILSYIINTYGKPIPNSVKKGLADRLLTFNEYQLQKYNSQSKDIKLKDLVCLTHPKAKTEVQNDMFKRLLEDKLETPYTWETELSAKGNTKEVWEGLIASKKVGYMAMLRNLRNIIKANPNNIDMVYDFLSNRDAVLNNKQLPFRYFSAYKTLQQENLGSSKVYNILEEAIKLSTQNVQTLKGKTLIACDVSGSMSSAISNKSTIKCSEIATLLMSMGNYVCEDTILVTFDTNIRNVTMPSTNGIISNAERMRIDGGGTDITLPFRYLINNNIQVDRIIVLSDNEINSGWDMDRVSSWYNNNKVPCQKIANEYRNKINNNVWIHAVDLMGYGTQQFKGHHTNIIAGWSEKIFDFIHLAENGTDTLVKKIENYYF
jgi:hypothetical protein